MIEAIAQFVAFVALVFAALVSAGVLVLLCVAVHFLRGKK